jgi:pseudouridine-5'-phosphate glycosidase
MPPRLNRSLPPWLQVSPEVAEALSAGTPVVALETAVLTHGLPRPLNLELAREMETLIRAGGACPATVGLVDGQIHLGLSPDQLERLGEAADARKINRRDLGVAVARRQNGGTTVSSTMHVAHAAGVRILATGGIGGVHRGTAGDVSPDLPELARTPMAVVCAGAKSILDLPRTLEWLETAGVPVIGWQTDEFPAFFSRTSGLRIHARVETSVEAAAVLRAHWSVGLGSGVLVCVPCPEEEALPREAVEGALERALVMAGEEGISGKALTPYLLSRVSELTQGASLRANLALLRQDARVAAELALALGLT